MTKDEVLAVLERMTFDGKGYCVACGGWNCSPNGCTPGKHTADCPFVLARAAVAALFGENETLRAELARMSDEREALRTKVSGIACVGYALEASGDDGDDAYTIAVFEAKIVPPNTMLFTMEWTKDELDAARGEADRLCAMFLDDALPAAPEGGA